MSSVPYSRYLFGIVPWYSFLIVAGAALAVYLASREESRAGLKKDTVVDFALIVLPCGIIGARLYYVAFSWDQFRGDILSVFRIWEGGIAIYGAVLAGLLAALLFCRKRRISFLSLCDIIAPGLILAQAIGRWGNYFNQEAFGVRVTDPRFCFFPLAVQIAEGGSLQWHLATFFYESVWNLFVFLFLMIARRRFFRYRGDVISFYAFLYACGRFIVEDLRTDSLYAGSGIRISQLLSVGICLAILLTYFARFRTKKSFRSVPSLLFFTLSLLTNLFLLLFLSGLLPLSTVPGKARLAVLCSAALINVLSIIILYRKNAEGNIIYANVRN